MRELHLFAGIGGEIHDDIRTFQGASWRGRADNAQVPLQAAQAFEILWRRLTCTAS